MRPLWQPCCTGVCTARAHAARPMATACTGTALLGTHVEWHAHAHSCTAATRLKPLLLVGLLLSTGVLLVPKLAWLSLTGSSPVVGIPPVWGCGLSACAMGTKGHGLRIVDTVTSPRGGSLLGQPHPLKTPIKLRKASPCTGMDPGLHNGLHPLSFLRQGLTKLLNCPS